ncbi:SH3 domain-containing protein [Sphingobium sp. BHU LFT2]|nr:SH3 domain-containing protein [Sphingobium sp. BHU LFT2]
MGARGGAFGALSLTAPAVTAYVNADLENCRAAPNTGAPVVTKLAKGQNVSVKEGGGGWSHLATPPCWVASRFWPSML